MTILHLVHDPVSPDTVQALEEILERARAGIVTGFIIGLQRPHQRYTVHCVGTSCRNPTFSLGMCRAIDFELAKLLYGEGPETTF